MASLIRSSGVLRRVAVQARAAPAALHSFRHMATPAQSNEPPSFWEKTGRTGLPLLGAGLAAYLVSKEIIIFHYETIVVASVAGVTYFLVKKIGPSIAEALDERAQAIADSLSVGRKKKIAQLEKSIAHQATLAEGVSSIDEIFDINQELCEINREIQFRENQLAARDAAIAQLEAIVKVEAEGRKAEQDALVAKLKQEVLAGLKGQESAILKKTIADIAALAAKTA